VVVRAGLTCIGPGAGGVFRCSCPAQRRTGRRTRFAISTFGLAVECLTSAHEGYVLGSEGAAQIGQFALPALKQGAGLAVRALRSLALKRCSPELAGRARRIQHKVGVGLPGAGAVSDRGSICTAIPELARSVDAAPPGYGRVTRARARAVRRPAGSSGYRFRHGYPDLHFMAIQRLRFRSAALRPGVDNDG
jgi:hypothetical protein